MHGAVLYALADHAFSAACNAYGRVTLGLSITIQFIATHEAWRQSCRSG
ncbi:hotdog domain-containing protein [Terribacillus saccharophilus]